MVLGAHFGKSHRIAGCSSAIVPSRNTILQGIWQSPFEYSYILSHYQSETSVLNLSQVKKVTYGYFSTIILKNKSFSLSWASGNIWRDYLMGLVWSRSPTGITALCFGILGNPLATGWRWCLPHTIVRLNWDDMKEKMNWKVPFNISCLWLIRGSKNPSREITTYLEHFTGKWWQGQIIHVLSGQPQIKNSWT